MEPNEALPVYQICVAGHLDERWLRWFEGLVIVRQANAETTISGPMDQAALHGFLGRIRDLGLELISVQRLTSHEPVRKNG